MIVRFQPFSRSEAAWNTLTNERDRLRNDLAKARDEIKRQGTYLTLMTAPVAFSALADSTLRELAKEFANRIAIAQRGLNGEAVPTPISEYASKKVFDGARPISPEETERLKENYHRTHGDEASSP